MPLIARCTATLAGDELVLTMHNGAEHSRIPVDDTMDPVEAMERMHQGTMPVRLLWTVDRTNGCISRAPQGAMMRTGCMLISP